MIAWLGGAERNIQASPLIGIYSSIQQWTTIIAEPRALVKWLKWRFGLFLCSKACICTCPAIMQYHVYSTVGKTVRFSTQLEFRDIVFLSVSFFIQCFSWSQNSDSFRFALLADSDRTCTRACGLKSHDFKLKSEARLQLHGRSNKQTNKQAKQILH